MNEKRQAVTDALSYLSTVLYEASIQGYMNALLKGPLKTISHTSVELSLPRRIKIQGVYVPGHHDELLSFHIHDFLTKEGFAYVLYELNDSFPFAHLIACTFVLDNVDVEELPPYCGRMTRDVPFVAS